MLVERLERVIWVAFILTVLFQLFIIRTYGSENPRLIIKAPDRDIPTSSHSESLSRFDFYWTLKNGRLYRTETRNFPIREFRKNQEFYVNVDPPRESTSDSLFITYKGRPAILVTEVAKNSLVDRIGIRKGDKVLSVNGHTVSNPDEAMALYKKLKSEKEFAVEVERGGQLQYLVYRITD